MPKNVQISQETFINLIKYFCLDNTSVELQKAITEDLEAKLDKLIQHETYTQYKTSSNAEEREKARQQYLEQKGIHKDFRW
jgi:actin-related protein